MLVQQLNGRGTRCMRRDLIECEKLVGTKREGTQQFIGLTSWFQVATGKVLVEPMIACHAQGQFTCQGRITCV